MELPQRPLTQRCRLTNSSYGSYLLALVCCVCESPVCYVYDFPLRYVGVEKRRFSAVWQDSVKALGSVLGWVGGTFPRNPLFI